VSLFGKLSSAYIINNHVRHVHIISSNVRCTLPPQPAGRKGPRQHMIFPFPLARRTLMALLFPYQEIFTHIKLSQDPLFTLRRSDFSTSRIQWSSIGHSNPRNPKQSTLTFPLSFRDFPCHDFSDHDVEKIVSSNPESLFSETPIHSQAFTFQRHFTSSALWTLQYHES
jgi:hypothetical protein